MSCFLGFSCSSKSYTVVFTFKEAVTSSTLYQQALDSPVSPTRDSEAFSDLSIDAPALHFLFPLGRGAFLRLYPFSQSCKTRPGVEGPSFVSQGQCPKLLVFVSLQSILQSQDSFLHLLISCLQRLALSGHGWTERVKGVSEEFGVLGMTVGQLGFIDEAPQRLISRIPDRVHEMVSRKNSEVFSRVSLMTSALAAMFQPLPVLSLCRLHQ